MPRVEIELYAARVTDESVAKIAESSGAARSTSTCSSTASAPKCCGTAGTVHGT